VNHELDVDKFHEKDSRLYQVMLNTNSPDGIMTSESTPGPLAKSLVEEIPEIEYAVSVVPVCWKNKVGVLSAGNNNLKAAANYVGDDFFHVFTYPLIHGNPEQVLSDRNAILISDDLALKLFNTTEDVVGKTAEWNQENFSREFLISGVFRKPPPNSTSQFDLLLNYDLFLDNYPNSKYWDNNDPNTYIALKNRANLGQVNAKVSEYLKSKVDNTNSTLFIRKYSDKYLYDKYENGRQSGGRIAYVRLFSAIALLIIIIASINFTNLSTAKKFRRLKEVGLNKVVGADKRNLVNQHLMEATLMTLLSLITATVIVMLSFPKFSAITGKHLVLDVDMGVIFSILGIVIFTVLVSGLYPALFLSNINPANILRGNLPKPIRGIRARSGLVVFQFITSVVLIVSVIVVYRQMSFVQSKDLGYKIDRVIYFPLDYKSTDPEEEYSEAANGERVMETFLQKLKNVPGVINASNFWHNIVGQTGSTSGVDWEGKEPGFNIRFGCISAGYDYMETLGIELKEGRTFSRNYGREKSKIIFNEAAINAMDLKGNIIGQTIRLWGEEREIIGVAEDFHYKSLYDRIHPLYITLSLEKQSSNILVKIQSGTETETIDRIKKIYREYNPGVPFDFKYLDEDLQTLYASEKRMAVLSRYFAGIAVIISCLGLLGLTAFTVQKRSREIVVRKVFGSSNFRIMTHLTGDISKLIFVSILFALPLSYLIAREWLNSFAYRVELSVWYFVSAGLLTIIMVWLTIGMQVFKAAKRNPAQYLREE
jgi:ABC-type antimicrobial peptide transport system permease subunit